MLYLKVFSFYGCFGVRLWKCFLGKDNIRGIRGKYDKKIKFILCL